MKCSLALSACRVQCSTEHLVLNFILREYQGLFQGGEGGAFAPPPLDLGCPPLDLGCPPLVFGLFSMRLQSLHTTLTHNYCSFTELYITNYVFACPQLNFGTWHLPPLSEIMKYTLEYSLTKQLIDQLRDHSAARRKRAS